MLRILTRTIVLLGASLLLGAAAPERSPVGFWLTAGGNGIVEVFRCDGEAFCGRVAWFRSKPNDPNPQALDLKNPDPSRRGRSLCGLQLMSGFKPADTDNWEGGAVYDPESGNTYRGTMRLQPDGALRLRGYIGISLFGRSEVWTRFTQKLPSCPTR